MASCVAASASASASIVNLPSLAAGGSLGIPRQSALQLRPGLVAVKRSSSVFKKPCAGRVVMSASQVKDLDVAGPTAAMLMAAMVIPEIAEAAQPGISPSLKNLLLSVVAGGVVALVIGVAVAGVSVFDPVKRK